MMTLSDIELLEQLAISEAREDFWAYRQFINGKKLKIGWWQKEIAEILMQFYQDLIDGLRPIYIIQAPPQHGKSSQIVDLISWMAGKNPDLRTIYASFSERLGVRSNLKLQKIFDSEKYKKIFPETKINSSNAVTVSSQTLRNREIIEYVDHDGFFRNTTVRGSVTGESLDIGIVDDPIKGRAEANSATIRDLSWNWFTDDFFSRFSDEAGMLMILTRWHVDDPAGRLQKYNPDVKVFRYPALAEKNEENRKIGEALFPEHKPVSFLLERKKIMKPSSWEALYQQNPFVDAGEYFDRKDWQFYTPEQKPKNFTRIIQSWDLNGEKNEDNDMTVGAVWGFVQGERPQDHRAYLLCLVRDQTNFVGQIKMFSDLSGMEPRAFKKLIEAKSNGGPLISILENKIRGIHRVNPTKSKIDRAESVTPYIKSKQVFLPDPATSPWVNDFITEHTMFPNGDYDDQVDTTSQALFHLFGPYKENLDVAALKRMYS